MDLHQNDICVDFFQKLFDLQKGIVTVKIATNASLAERKSGWIDFDASPTLAGSPLTNELFDYIIKVAEGEKTKNELHGYKEISIFKDGVTL